MIRCITGDVAPDAVAVVLPHTHVLHRIAASVPATTDTKQSGTNGSRDSATDIRNEDLQLLRISPGALGGRNLVLEKEDEAFRELEALSAHGQSALASLARPLVVDVTVPAEGRDEFMVKRQQLATKLNMHIVTVTTCDVTRVVFSPGLPAQDCSERLAKTLETDLLFGLDAGNTKTAAAAPRVCAGAIYQQVHIASTGIVSESDAIIAHAIALAQQRTHAPVYLSFSYAIDSNGTMPAAPSSPRDTSTRVTTRQQQQQDDATHRIAICKYVQLLLAHGADASQLIVCHADQWCDNTIVSIPSKSKSTSEASSSPSPSSYETNVAFLERLLTHGVNLLFTMIGVAAVSDVVVLNPSVAGVVDSSAVLASETCEPPREPPRDSSIARCIAYLLSTNVSYANQLLLSSSMQQRIEYARYGGGGYALVFTHFRDRLLQLGVSPVQFSHLVQTNPVRVLSWYIAPAAAAALKDYLTCSICEKQFEPVVGEYFTKFAFTYCGVKCLSKHARRGFGALPLP